MLTLAFFVVLVGTAVPTAATAVRSTSTGPVQRLMPVVALAMAAALWTAWSGTWRIVPAMIIAVALIALVRTWSTGRVAGHERRATST